MANLLTIHDSTFLGRNSIDIISFRGQLVCQKLRHGDMICHLFDPTLIKVEKLLCEFYKNIPEAPGKQTLHKSGAILRLLII